ncbi:MULTISPECIES: hypothetical protein [unclassified Cryobacterium]|uniref:hypothetical protein n=1 Tax=unclassified Cryobacterium TaxID=2649013 RepID=UPI002AB4CF11|nr:MULTISPECIES: hypothetical protein [unclassified Cryobacterium]MDY7528150.1 hypothetical protein [Cryobacterium sp. 10C2]MDY7556101.1 hypothetical protein [Cryobacterium sp. 10C3]MEB0289351.1 hypothetical protein [Cryobacterium sp. 10C2]
MDGKKARKSLHCRASQIWNTGNDRDARSAEYEVADRCGAIDEESRQRVGRRPSNWVSALYVYEDFWFENDRSPRENTRVRSNIPLAERHMGEWARYQRRFETRLSTYQLIRLDVSPAFAWDPHERAWQKQLEACKRHVTVTGQLPFLNGNNAREFALARWLGRQLRLLQTGTLLDSRAVQLGVLLALGKDGYVWDS